LNPNETQHVQQTCRPIFKGRPTIPVYRRFSNFQATKMVLKTVTTAEKIAILLFDMKLQGRGLMARFGLQ